MVHVNTLESFNDMSVSDDLVRLGNIGTTFTATVTKVVSNSDVAVDLTNSTLVQLEFEKDDGTRIVKTATIVTPPGTDGIINFKDIVGILDTIGRWKIRGIATFSNGDFFKGSWKGFHVAE